MQQQGVWIGMGTLLLASANPKRAEGFVGAFSGFACSADNIVEAMKALHREFEESGYALIGVESMLPVHMLDRQLTDSETELVEATSRYPVQFKNVHLHKGDG